MTLDVTFTDLLCGAGGSTSGATQAGFIGKLGINHWERAIETHSENFPQMKHDCADISQTHPGRYFPTDVLIASPACQAHSNAAGVKRSRQQRNFFEYVDPEAERSRATAWNVVDFAEYHQYKAIVVENVVEFRHWALYDSWIHAMTNLGYKHRLVSLNSQFALPTPQSRNRIYIVFWKNKLRAPDLEFRPLATCIKCGEKESYQAFKPGRTYGQYGKNRQYVYLCSGCHIEVVPHSMPASSVIDWSLPIPRVGDRKKPLCEKTLERIRVGIKKFVDPFILGHRVDASYRSAEEPLLTIAAGGKHLFLVTPSTESHDNGENNAGAKPFLVGNYSPGWVRSVEGQLGTITGDDHHSLVTPPGFLFSYRRDSDGQPVVQPLQDSMPTVTAHASQHYICAYYSAGNQIASVNEPMPTVTTKDRLALVNGKVNVDDCGMRMLTPEELKLGMGFNPEYVIKGTAKERVKQAGNAVTPPAMAMIMQRIAQMFA